MSLPGTRSRVPLARAIAALCGAWCLFQVGPWSPRFLAPGILFLLVIWLLVMIVRPTAATVSVWILLVVLWFAAAAGMTFWLAKAPLTSDPGTALAVVSVVTMVAAVVSVLAPRRLAVWGIGLVLVMYAGVLAVSVAAVRQVVDVQVLLEAGIEAVLSGSSPYAIRVPDVYPPEDSTRYYGPGVVVDGYLTYGYPYLPVPLLLDAPAYLLGDVRGAHLVAVLITVLLAWTMATDAVGRLASVLLVLNPSTQLVILNYWVEPLLGCLLAVALWCMTRRMRGVGLALGLLLASKQYAISYVPALWTVARATSRRVVAVAVGTAGVVVVVFAAMDVGAFRRSAIEFMFVQPYREDSMSLVAGLAEIGGPVPGWLLALSPVFGLVASGLVSWRASPGPTALALGVGAGLLLTVLLSKMAFPNYFSFIGCALLLAVVTWPADDPATAPVARTAG